MLHIIYSVRDYVYLFTKNKRLRKWENELNIIAMEIANEY